MWWKLIKLSLSTLVPLAHRNTETDIDRVTVKTGLIIIPPTVTVVTAVGSNISYVINDITCIMESSQITPHLCKCVVRNKVQSLSLQDLFCKILIDNDDILIVNHKIHYMSVYVFQE